MGWRQRKKGIENGMLLRTDLNIDKLSVSVWDEKSLEFVTKSLEYGVQVKQLDVHFKSSKAAWYPSRLNNVDPKLECYMEYCLSPQSVKAFAATVNPSTRLILHECPVYVAKKLVTHRPSSNETGEQIGFVDNVRSESIYAYFRGRAERNMNNHFEYFEIDLMSGDKWMPLIFNNKAMRLAFTKLQVRLQDGMQDQAEIFLAWLKTWSAWGTLIRELVVVLADPPSVTDNSPTYPLPWEEIASFMNSENSTQIYYISLRDERRKGGDKWKLESLLDIKYTSNPNHQTRETVVDLYEDILLYYLDNN